MSSRPKKSLSFAADLMAMPISLWPVVFAWGLPLWLLRFTWNSNLFYLAVVILPVLAAISLIAGVRFIRLFLPRMKKGLYPLGLNRGFISWYAHLALSRTGELSGLQPLLQSFFVLKHLYWWAQGARIAFGVNSAMGLSIVDYPMIQVGHGSTLSDGVNISAHTFVGDRLLIAPVTMGKNVFVGYKSFVGARSRIGDNVRLGVCSRINGDVLESGTKIENFAWERGNPKRKSASSPEH